MMELKNAIDDYIEQRIKLIEMGEKFKDKFGGNDNLIGRIGKYYAIEFLSKHNQNPSVVQKSNNSGYSLIDNGNNLKTLVRVITCENKSGRTTKIKPGWDQFVLIELDDKYEPLRIGLSSRAKFEEAIKNGELRAEPFASLSMFKSDLFSHVENNDK